MISTGVSTSVLDNCYTNPIAVLAKRDDYTIFLNSVDPESCCQFTRVSSVRDVEGKRFASFIKVGFWWELDDYHNTLQAIQRNTIRGD